ncbi:hypothetical protein JCM19239_6356 [Vibrio variabilis]|uniref:Lipoprotein n=1 Tax=Vibrio variabilis TaxID=990271 RepID=A0ABQ0JRL0_9VIBR|nr:hypothetical protein JCM19239_6356 [Vibrio variabilis]
MRKLLCISLLAVLSGCAQFGQEESVDEVADSTTAVDAVEAIAANLRVLLIRCVVVPTR